MDYLAHSKNEAGREQPLAEHLQAVAKLAGEFAAAWGAEDEARVAGLLHDLGKYGHLFQERLKGRAARIDHWSAGAWAALLRLHQAGMAPAAVVEAHHIGLQRRHPREGESWRTLHPEHLAESHPRGLRLSAPSPEPLLDAFRADGLVLPEGGEERASPSLLSTSAMLDVRMLFSALVDADYLDTAAHFDGPREAGPVFDPGAAKDALLAHVGQVAADSKAAAPIRELRGDLLKACLDAGSLPPGLFTLTAPTGGGKTLALLAFALQHALRHHLRRVVVVIPYLTILDQTVGDYGKALAGWIGDGEADQYLLQDHSLARAAGAQDAEDDDQKPGRLLADNWDAPVVVTTSVQFLESLFADRPRRCRKLHRLARSVILFDEVQTLPLALATATLGALSRLVERYGSTVVFSTATQPAFAHLHGTVQKHSAQGWRPREIAGPDLRLFQRCRRTTVSWPAADNSPLTWPELAEQIAQPAQALVIVNLKRHALALFDELQERGTEGLAHLSTNMCPAHRQQVLSGVRERLDAGQPCRLVSTQCIEAGVDVDFPVVYRAWGPLDAIAQAAGRCNRHGRLDRGEVRVFVPDDQRGLYPDPTYQQAASVTQVLAHERGPEHLDIDDPALFERYYRELYSVRQLENDKGALADAILDWDFEKVGQEYRVIKQDAINVVAPYDPGAHAELLREAETKGLTRKWVARARPHAVSVFRPRGDDPILRYIEWVKARGEDTEWAVYLFPEHYHEDTGLRPPTETQCIIA